MRGYEALPRDEPAGLSESISYRRGLLGLRGEHALAEGMAVPAMPQGQNVLETQHQAFRLFELRATDLGDGRDRVSQEPDPFAEVVLGDLPDGNVLEGDLDAQSPEACGDQVVPDGVVDRS